MTGPSPSARTAARIPEPGTMTSYLDCRDRMVRCQVVTLPYRRLAACMYGGEFWLVDVRVEGESEPRAVAVERVEV